MALIMKKEILSTGGLIVLLSVLAALIIAEKTHDRRIEGLRFEVAELKRGASGEGWAEVTPYRDKTNVMFVSNYVTSAWDDRSDTPPSMRHELVLSREYPEGYIHATVGTERARKFLLKSGAMIGIYAPKVKSESLPFDLTLHVPPVYDFAEVWAYLAGQSFVKVLK